MSKKVRFAVLGVGAIVILSLSILCLTPSAPLSGSSLGLGAWPPVSSGVPARLQIPEIGVDADVTAVGLTPDGAVGIPKGPKDTAWYALGAKPGEVGTAIIDGHFGWKNGIQAVFDNLSKLHVGDKIYVIDSKGAVFTFVVRTMKTYGQNDNPADVFVSTDSKAHLNLITCGGTWNSAEKSYSNRTVVFADLQ